MAFFNVGIQLYLNVTVGQCVLATA